MVESSRFYSIVRPLNQLPNPRRTISMECENCFNLSHMLVSSSRIVAAHITFPLRSQTVVTSLFAPPYYVRNSHGHIWLRFHT